MEDRSISAAPGEMPLRKDDPGGSRPSSGSLGDPRALTILTTEHWGLLSARSLVYNEAFARAGMFLAFLSATLVALGLVATATGFSDGFMLVAAVVLSLDLFIGLASLGRLTGATSEDIRFLQGMNRLRHAYHDMVPGLEPYFSSSHHDDAVSVLGLYGTGPGNQLGNFLHALTTTPMMVGVICSAVAGAIAALVAMLLTHAPILSGLGGLGAFLLAFVVITAFVHRRFGRLWRSLEVRFPRDKGSRS
jgi:hypothetical protein